MKILEIVLYVIVPLAVILPGYFMKKNKPDKLQRLIGAIAGVLLLALVWLLTPDPPGHISARIGLTVMAVIPIVFWFVGVMSKQKIE